MASERPLQRWLRTLAVLTAVVLPAVAVTTVAATAGTSTKSVNETDDLNLMRVAMNAAARTDRLRADAPVSTAPLTADQLARASRTLVRKELTNGKYVRPVPGPVTQWYGTHPGLDIAPPYGTPIGAAHSGVVTFVGWEDGYGMHVEVTQLDGFVTTYSHMSAWTVTLGQLVVAGQQLGNIGSTGYSTGPHLHFEVHIPGGARMDPAIWLYLHGVRGE